MPMAVLIMAALGFVLASLLVLSHRHLKVDEDPRVDAVHRMLPGTNCGACGFPGCLGMAEGLVSGAALPGKCTVMTADDREALAAFLGVSAEPGARIVARLACAGGSNVARNRARYAGLSSCRAAALVSGGGKACAWGCLGLGDCAAVCDFDAIAMNPHALPVVSEAACTACGDCVDACPKDLFSLHPLSHRLWVACRNLEHGDAVLADCDVGCNGCGKCAVDAPAGVITMTDNLPVVDYQRNHDVRGAIERCPTGAIVWFEDGVGPVTGQSARNVVREAPRYPAPT